MYWHRSRRIDTSRYKTKEILLSIVGQRVLDLRPSNKAKTFFKCTCPFHEEKTASMKFYRSRVLNGWGYKCFGCGTAGDVFTFLIRYERWEFWDALAYLKKYHVPFSRVITYSTWIQLEIPFPKLSDVIDLSEEILPF
mgnify:FL=1